MNKFIVWYSNDINEDKFSMEFSLQELIAQDHLDYVSDSKQLVNYKVDSINNGIGLKDINNKKIYTDSSIVEFKHKTLVDKVIGYFTFANDEYLRYEIKILRINPSVKNKDNFVFAKSLFSDIKIIDTIQENKLGLIK